MLENFVLSVFMIRATLSRVTRRLRSNYWHVIFITRKIVTAVNYNSPKREFRIPDSIFIRNLKTYFSYACSTWY